MTAAIDYTKLAYTSDPYRYVRRKTRVVMVGDVAVGGDNPIRVQSMTTADTLDTDATVAETVRLVNVGCEIVRITTPTAKDAENLKNIRAALTAKGISVPLVADIHFNPNAAMEAAKWADKVRINPGNFADTKRWNIREYTQDEYQKELGRIEEKFAPLVLRCKELGRSMRIGTNHGSLSDRILNFYGDTPEGMVESAFEFATIARKYDYHDLIFSMKSSNPKVMIEAYRLLAARLDALGWDYPFHLGVTEAGNGEDGRIKSAIGIGALLEDGIGDTIRVSLTEDPEREVPVAFRIARRYTPVDATLLEKAGVTDATPTLLASDVPNVPTDNLPDYRDPFHYERRETQPVTIGSFTIGGEGVPQVIAPLTEAALKTARRELPLAGGKKKSTEAPTAPDLYLVENDDAAGLEALRHGKIAGLVGVLNEAEAQAAQEAGAGTVFFVSPHTQPRLVEVVQASLQGGKPLMLVGLPVENDYVAAVEAMLETIEVCEDMGQKSLILAMSSESASECLRAYRLLAARLHEVSKSYPLHLIAPVLADADPDDVTIDASIATGGLLIDGFGNSIEIGAPPVDQDGLSPEKRVQLAFNILQAAGARSSKAEFIACPSCGRTLFDLQETTERIKSKTGHLVGVKIAIMGCIVNGLGELADADFGYMGGAPGKVNLFVGKECVEKGVPTEIADERLIALIKQHGRWVEDEE